MPVFMGVNKGYEEDFSDMTFLECTNCGSIQIKELIEPEKLYISNHNLQIIGELWKNHYNEFINLLKYYVKNNHVLEIGDPSFKLSSKLSSNVKSWDIVELNPNPEIPIPPNTQIVKSYFDENFKINSKVDVIIHSHFLEHVTNIKNHLDLCFDILKAGGKLIFSVPNLEYILMSDNSPINVLHFEHTFFYSEKILTKILHICGFKTLETKKYKNHSIFFICEKNYKQNLELDKTKYSVNFLLSYEKYKKYVKNINFFIEKNKTKNIFLYGAHVSSQFLINLGLNIDKIESIVDNSTDKQGFKLYGTQKNVISPKELENSENPVVILNHMSIYSEEITNQIKKINPNVEIL
jgi:predicted SAM-dependent methyltransferase